MQGSGLLKRALRLPGVECVGAAEQKNKHIIQTGSQRRSSVVYEKAKDILDSGTAWFGVKGVPSLWLNPEPPTVE